VAGLPDVIGSVLIANRGEIAVRIARTCRELGIRSVGIHAPSDRTAVHARTVDAAVELSQDGAPGYLDRERIVELALAAGADAIHPGYGFLSEDARFARLVRSAGLVFVGPSPAVIERMGSKREAKAAAEAAGAPVVPGYAGSDQSVERLTVEAQAAGFPLMIKASAGGGGRGMRIVRRPDELGRSLAEARQEAISAFGDGTLLLERLIAPARHVEVQVAGDQFGQVIHLFERDCSIQRRHQKVIEESPAAWLEPETRAGLHRSAVAIARAAGYDNVGTVEFLVDPATGAHYFLEMNTRLQVEHPVTELVTGIDLVALQLRLAAGLPLGFEQSDVALRGAAIEARIVAEDPAGGYLPATGTIRCHRVPSGDGVRVDSGIALGSAVTPLYDGLLAKVIAWGPDRAAARARLAAALGAWGSAGVVTNARWLTDLMGDPAFAAEPLTTDYLSRTGLDRWQWPDRSPAQLAAALALAVQARESVAAGPWTALGGWRLGASGAPVVLTVDGTQRAATVAGSAGRYEVGLGGRSLEISIVERGSGDAVLEIDGRIERVACTGDGEWIWLSGLGGDLEGRVGSPLPPESDTTVAGRAGAGRVVAPLPGVVSSVGAQVGERVEGGQVVAVLEAMKLVHSLTVAASGVVSAVHCRPGMTVAGGQVLIELELANQETS
jgi:acetyl/propionyl-CoA carboxylase alpha subunit